VVITDRSASEFVHWISWNIWPSLVVPAGLQAPGQANNGFNNLGYNGPCPPSGTHSYRFAVYALDSNLNISSGKISAVQFHAYIQDKILMAGGISGTFAKQ